MRYFFFISIVLSAFMLVADSSGDFIECVGEGSSEIVCWIATDDIDPPLVSTNIVMTKDHCEQIKRTVTESYNAIGSLIGNVSQSASFIWSDADRMESTLGTYYNDIVLIHDSLEQDLRVNPNQTVSNNVERLESLASNVYDLQPGFMAIKGEADQIKERAGIISNILDNVQSTVSRVKCVEGEECSSSGDGSVQCPCVEQFNSVVEAVERVRSELMSLHADANAAWAHLVQLETLVSNVCESAEFIRRRFLAPDDRMWGDVLSIITNMVYVSSNNIAAIENRSLDISKILEDVQRAVRGDLTDQNNIQLSNEGVIALYNLIGNFSTYSLLASGLSEFRHQFGIFSNTVYSLFHEFNQTFRGRFAGNNLGYQLSQQRSRDYLYRVSTNYLYNPDIRYTTLVANGQGGLTNWFGRMEYYQQALLGWYEDRNPESQLTEDQPKQQSSFQNILDDGTNNISGISEALVRSSNVLNRVVSPIADSLANARLSASLPSHVVLFPNVTIMNYDMEFHIDTSQISEYCDKARDITTLLWVVGFWVFCVVGIGVVVRTGIKAALWLIKYISETS